jgi:hypothetical protein
VAGVEIESVKDLISFTETNDTDVLVYRGQSRKDWGLTPTVYRGIDKTDLDSVIDSLDLMERDLYREFANKSVRRLPASEVFRDRSASAWETLISAQHYGTPTRLLDWTANPFAAAYFAASDSPQDDAVIWFANPSKLPVPARLGRLHEDRGLRVEQVRRYAADADLSFMVPVSKMLAGFPTEQTDTQPNPDPRFDQTESPDYSGIMVFLEVPFTNPRIEAQSGLFSVYISTGDQEIVLDQAEYISEVETKFCDKILGRIIIPASAKVKIISDLDRHMKVNAFSLFPDLEGLSAYLRWKHNSEVRSILP